MAASALSEFSTTCFVVSDPWEKWGDALKASGYHKNDDIQVRYYTYDFVRNAIYARAMKAFEWSLKQKNLPDDTDPGTADVLGVVYAVKKDSGGAFGIFVPTRVDFVSHGSVIVDPRASIMAGTWYLDRMYKKALADKKIKNNERKNIVSWRYPLEYYYAGPVCGAKAKNKILIFSKGTQKVIDKRGYSKKIMTWAKIIKRS